MKKILLIATGGTIASIKTKNGMKPNTSAEELISYIPEIKDICGVDYIQLFNVDSTNIQPEHWIKIAKCIKEKYEEYDGFIITHGTDTMAYTSSAVSYLIQNPKKPVILTGSQKPINADITDAKKNLIDSFTFACDDDIHGVYLVFNGKAIVGTRARKLRSKSYNAFESINYPVAAFIDENRIIKYVEKERKESDIVFHTTIDSRVFLLKLIPGMEPDILDYISDNYDVIVIEGYGVGGLPFHDKRNFFDKLQMITKKGKIIVLSTQVMLEGSDAKLYEVGHKTVSNYNVLEAYDMTTESVVVKLMWITSLTKDFNEIKKLFYKKINHDILRID
ncbi:asparaginase [Anaerofustis stercorihominis]|uniref:asparaginase n=1 Tax=Anaerofustis stercorihominis TaxID=214853 RepID=UPI00214BCDA0|nr:asparaginase [Anaerofustis stercorihominis]MCR2032411.1 asparaginase [Anaerofustis stercorihominis]